MMNSLALQRFDADEENWPDLGANDRFETADYTSRDGASALAAKIEAYWRSRGQDVMLSLHNVGFHPAIRAARYDLRSDMVNGMPRNPSKSKVARAPDLDAEFDVD